MEINVTAENEASAIKQATDSIASQFAHAKIDKVDVVNIHEAQLHLGSRIHHAIFGHGVVHDMIPSINGAGESGCRVTVKFEDGTTKDLQLPHPSVTPEY